MYYCHVTYDVNCVTLPRFTTLLSPSTGSAHFLIWPEVVGHLGNFRLLFFFFSNTTYLDILFCWHNVFIGKYWFLDAVLVSSKINGQIKSSLKSCTFWYILGCKIPLIVTPTTASCSRSSSRVTVIERSHTYFFFIVSSIFFILSSASLTSEKNYRIEDLEI